jgi:hypothetical protein
MVKEVLIIQNPNSFPVAFKVKTTTPRQYCVRPNAGRIEPGETVDVQGMCAVLVDYCLFYALPSL